MATQATPENVTPAPVGSGDLLALLNEAYVFIAMRHRACDPWRKALDDWQARVEEHTGWSAFDQIKKSRANTKISNAGTKTK